MHYIGKKIPSSAFLHSHISHENQELSFHLTPRLVMKLKVQQVCRGCVETATGSKTVREAVSYRGLFTAGWFGVREKHCSRLEIYDRLRASEQPERRIGQCGSMTAWEFYEYDIVPANCTRTQWVVTQDSRSVFCFWSSWMFLPSFSCLFLFLTCLRRQYVRSSSNQVTGHLSLDL